METLLLNDSKKIDDIKLIFESNEININLKNLIHIEDISSKTTGILISRELKPSYLKPFVDYSIKKNIKVLAVGRALISLINTLKGTNEKVHRSFSGDRSTFISLGSRLAEIIGGAGPLKTNYLNSYEIPIENMPNNLISQRFMPYNNQIFIFPAWVKHYVIPFKSDVKRISVSGNITFDRDPEEITNNKIQQVVDMHNKIIRERVK